MRMKKISCFAPAAVFLLAAMVGCMAGATNSFANLIAHYAFENASNLGLDSSVNGYHATTAEGDPTQNTSDAHIGDGALDLDTNDGLGVTVGFPHAGLTTFTVAAWVRIDASVGGLRDIVNGRNSVTSGFLLYMDSSTDLIRFATYDGSAHILNSGVSMATGTWTHVAATYDGTTARIYVNGDLENSAAQAYTPCNIDDLGLGYRAPLASEFLGVAGGADLDDVGVWSGVLNETEIQHIMTNGIAVPEPSSLVLMGVGACLALLRRRIRK